MREEQATTDSSFLGTGWAFPPAFDNANHLVQMTHGVSNINQSIDVLLKTAQGSRSMLPDYGCNLSSFLFQRLDATLEGQIVQMVKQTLLNSEPRIVVEAVAVSQAAEVGAITITINYQLKLTNTRHNYVFPFSLIEATNLDVGV
jgi:phage baseplate assembly protein W